MGNCLTMKDNFEELIGQRFLLAVETNDLDSVELIIKKYCLSSMTKDSVLNINKPIVKLFNSDMNALGYSLFLGYTNVFILLLEIGRAKLSNMCQMYKVIGKRPIEILCECGHRKLLEYYMPFYMSKMEDLEDLQVDVSDSFTQKKKKKEEKIRVKLTPIQRAVDKERLGVVQFAYEYFKGKETPLDFNFHYQDEFTGDNCALISCKTGNIEVMRYLHEVVKVDYHILNKRKENAIQVLAVWSKKRKEVRFGECVKYLVETVGVDYTYQYEETILILEDKEVIEYLEGILKVNGYSIDKNKIDQKYEIPRNVDPGTTNPALFAKLKNVTGPEFNFKELFEDELRDSGDEVSSIVLQSNENSSLVSFVNNARMILE